MFNKPIAIATLLTIAAAAPLFYLYFTTPRAIQLNAPSLGLTLLSLFVLLTLAAWWGNLGRQAEVSAAMQAGRETARESGNVKWFNASKGFGFITTDNGEDVFVHFRSIRGEGHRMLHEGQRVEFSVSKGAKGLQAEDVALAG